MNKNTFNKLYRLLLQKASAVRTAKESEYFSEEDILRNLRRIGKFRNSNTPQVIMNLAAKHFQSLSDMIDYEFPKDSEKSPVQPIAPEVWDEKFVDSLNYLFKLYVSIKEERGDF